MVPCNMVAHLSDVADSGTMEALYAKGFLTSENSNSVRQNNGPNSNSLPPNKGQNKHKDHIHRNGNYSSSPHSEKETRKHKV